MKHKYLTIISLLVLVSLVLCIGAVATQRIKEKEEELSIDQVPDAVKATILAEAGDGTIKEIELENENGQTFYEADVIIDGQEFEIKVAPDGKLLGKEIDDEDGDDDDEDDENGDDENEVLVSIDQVPDVVKATILAEAGDGTIVEIEMENEDGQTIYEADVIIAGQEIEIKVAADGTLLGKAIEDDDEEEDED
jgi:uncharacterized membrane protein YkoI